MLEHLPLIVFLVTFVLIFVLRMPIPAGMIAACTLYFLTEGLIKGVGFGALITGAGGSLHLVAQKTIEAIFTNGTIVAVPLFIFAANVMNAGKITEYVFGTCMGLGWALPRRSGARQRPRLSRFLRHDRLRHRRRLRSRQA